MARAKFTYKTKSDLERLDAVALDRYIRVLQTRASVLGGPARKSTEKQLAVAAKFRRAREA
jgi:hypothetical protein